MANEQDRNPGAEQSDITKSQAQQQPQAQAGQQAEAGQKSGQFETGQQAGGEFSGDQSTTGQSPSSGSPDEGNQGDTLTQRRTDIEGGSLGGGETGEAESGFVGSLGEQDTSSELIDEEDEEFGRDGQGAPEGK